MRKSRYKKLIVGNWKMNPLSVSEASKTFSSIKKTASKLRNAETVIAPSFLHIETLKKLVGGHRCVLGAQDVFHESGIGSHTGSVSVNQLEKSGARYIIVGHSERRALGENDDLINKKLTVSLKAGLKAILCVGEESRDEHGNYLRVIENQLKTALKKIPRKYFVNLVVAYEPVWAIGKKAKRSASPEDVEKISIFIRKVLSSFVDAEMSHEIPVLYGGSVSGKNARSFLFEGKSDGLLVGRASLDAKSFSEILKIADEVKKD